MNFQEDNRSFSQSEIEQLRSIKRDFGRRAWRDAYDQVTAKAVTHSSEAKAKTLKQFRDQASKPKNTTNPPLRRGEVRKWDEKQQKYISNLD